MTMRYLVIYANGQRDEFIARSFFEFCELLSRGVQRSGPFDLIYCLGR